MFKKEEAKGTSPEEQTEIIVEKEEKSLEIVENDFSDDG
jgi:hypothetical protein